jgi:hypothetical protein
MQHLELTVGQNLVRRGAAGMGIEDHDVDQLRIDEPSATGELANGGKQDVGSLSFVTEPVAPARTARATTCASLWMLSTRTGSAGYPVRTPDQVDAADTGHRHVQEQ